MRIRYLKNTPEILAASPFIIAQPEQGKENWKEIMAERMGKVPEKLFLEIGCGKGGFLREMARIHPSWAFLGVEKYSTILARAVHNLDPEKDRNLALIRWEAESLEEVIAPREMDGIYLNFSDPWPKERHEKRRLTSDRFLSIYSHILKPGSVLRFKTDNDALFAFSLDSFQKNRWEITALTDDLHGEEGVLAAGNVMTEYEENYVRQGKKIHCLEAHPC